MKLVIDTNIILSAIIKDSKTRKIIIESDFDFYYPEISFDEIRKHKSMVLEKSGLSEKEYLSIMSLLLAKIHIVPMEQIS